MPLATLAQISPYDPAGSSRVAINLSSANHRAVTGLNGTKWEPAIVTPPVMTMTLWNGDFRAAVDAGSASLPIQMGVVKQGYPNADRYVWIGAPVLIYADQIGAAWPWTLRMSGVVTGFTRKGQVLSLTVEVDRSAFDKNVLTATYAGTTGIEGGADLKGRLKPLVIGWAQNVEPVLIDPVNNVYQFSGYGPIEAVSMLYERASTFGVSFGDYANYAALVAAAVPRGRWATCLASGLIKLGAPAYGVITGDVKGHAVSGTTPRLTGAVINLLASLAGVSGGLINTTSLSALDSAMPYPVNLSLTDQFTFTDLASQMALACNGQAGISLTGQFFVAPVTLSPAASLSLHSRGLTSPQVIVSEEQAVSVPYWKTVLGANRAWRVHTTEELAYAATLIPKGPYSNTETYADGNYVQQPDGSEWLYINPTPAAGNALPTWPTASNTYWQNKVPPLNASGISGLGPSATDPRGLDPLYRPGANLVPDGGLTLRATGWTLDPAWSLQVGSAGEGNFLFNTTGGTKIAFSPKFPAFEGVAFYLQAELYAAGVTGGSLKADILWLNASGLPGPGTSTAIVATNGTGFTRLESGALVAPTGTRQAQVRIYTEAATNTGAGARFVKVCTTPGVPFTDEATAGALYADSTSIDALKPAEAASDVTSDIVGLADIVVRADYLGAITDALPRMSTYTLSRQGTDVTTASAWSVSVASGTISATIGAATGVLSLNTTGSPATMTSADLVITAVYGSTTRKMKVRVTVEKGNPPSGGSGGGTSASASIAGTVSSTTMTAVSPEITITVGAGTAGLAASYTFTSASGTPHVFAQWYWWNGSAWVAQGSEVQSTTPNYALDGSPGEGQCNFTATGFSASSSQKFRLYARRASGTGAINISGDAAAVGS